MTSVELGQISVVSPRLEEVHPLDLIINVILISRRRRVFSREYHNNDKSSSLLQPAQVHGQGREKVRILIVDDEPTITLALLNILSLSGFEYVDALNDSLLALENFKPSLYYLVIPDIVMPKMDRFALFKNSKEIDQVIKVCFITTYEVNFQELRIVFPAAAKIDDIGCLIKNSGSK